MKKLAASLLLALTLLSTTRAETPTVNPFVDADEIDVALATTFLVARDFPDSAFDGYYFRPTREQLEDIIHFYQLRRDLDKWTEDASDCDDIGREFMHVSHVWFRRTLPELRASISVAMVYVKIDGDYGPLFPSSAGEHTYGLHVLNLVWLADGSWVFVEPQTGCIAPVEGLLCEGVIHVFRVDV